MPPNLYYYSIIEYHRVKEAIRDDSLYYISNHLLKLPEGCFKHDIINDYGLSKVEAQALWDYVSNFIKEHYSGTRFDN